MAIRSMIYNFVAAMKDIQATITANTWKKLEPNEDEPETPECKTLDFHAVLQEGDK